MKTKMTVASVLLSIVAAFMILAGIVYSRTPGIMPYHVRFLGKTHAELDPQFAALAIQSLRIIGSAYLALGAATAALVWLRFRQGDQVVRWVITLMLMTAFIPGLKVTLSVGLDTPWWIFLICIVFTLTAFLLSWPSAGAQGAPKTNFEGLDSKPADRSAK